MTQQELRTTLISLGMHPDSLDADACAEQFRACMRAGLRGESRGMLMLQTYLSPDGEVPADKPVIVLDAGGTNFRRAVATFDKDGRLHLDDFEKTPLPGTHGEISVNEFFDALAERILPVVNRSDRIGFCFSYPTRALPNMDGELQQFCKEVRVRDSENISVCAELKKALRRKGVTEKKHCVLLNDSVAALLGGKAAAGNRSFGTYLGYIYGTGTNCCYTERTERIADVAGYSAPRMIVNMESGMHVGFPMGSADIVLDRESEFPGDHMFEKMISGAYLGRLMALAAQFCAKRGAFSEPGTAALMQTDRFELRDVGDFVDGGTPAVFAAYDAADSDALRQIFTALYERAAKLVLLTIECVLRESETGSDPAHPACITMEGTTFQKSRVFRDYFFRGCDELRTRGLYTEILECADTTLAGAAIAGLLN